METKTKITVETSVNASVEKAWETFTEPRHITQWYNASEDWHAPSATNDLRDGGKFVTNMAARDGSVSFNLEGIYTKVEPHKTIEYTLADDRTVVIHFHDLGDSTRIVETFEAESMNPVDMQRDGWQAILDNFKKYTEAYN